MVQGWRWKAAAILGLLFVLVTALHLGLELLHPLAHRVESRLLGIAAHGPLLVGAAAVVGYSLWLTSKALVFPALVLAIAFVAEARLSKAERKPKNYLTAALVQVVYFYPAYLAALLCSKLVPVSKAPLLSLPAGADPVASSLFTFAMAAFFLVVYDVLLYWTHRAHHHVPVLWKFHAIHHSPRDLDVLHNYLHPVEQLIRYFSVALPLNFLVQIDQEQFYLIFTFLALQNQLTHMNAPLHFGPLGKVLVDNRHHFIHHSSERSHFNRNYAGIFSFTDRLFGTFHAPGPMLPQTGFSTEKQPVCLGDFIFARTAPRPSPAPASIPLGPS